MKLSFVAFALALLPAAMAHAAPSGPQGENWDSIKLLPDLEGSWQSFTPPVGGNGRSRYADLFLTPEWLKKAEALNEVRSRGGDVEGRQKYCLQMGFPGGMAGPAEIHDYIMVPGRVIMTDVSGFQRHFYTDGRKRHIGPPTMQGSSSAHWEAGVLVIDTVNLHPENEVTYGLTGGPDMHITERMYLTPEDMDVMQIDTVIEAPRAFAKPVSFFVKYRRHRDWPMFEWNCEQNNRDIDASGGQQLDLTPPPLDEAPMAIPHIAKRSRGSRK